MAWGELVRSAPDRVKPEVVENVALGTRQTAARIRELALARTRLEGEVRRYFDDYDLWITPTAQALPFDASLRYPTEVAGEPMPDYLGWMRSVCVVSAMDVPAISVPVGFSSGGLPVGAQIVAAHGGDALLLRVARALEDLIGAARVHPRLGE
jgi:amidase